MNSRSIVELRGVAQSMGCKWSFSDTKEDLIQKIEQKRDIIVPPADVPVVPMPVDQRLRSKPPSKVSTDSMLADMLKPFISLGLVFQVDDDGQGWVMRYNDREDSGNMRQPPRNIIKCAQRLMT